MAKKSEQDIRFEIQFLEGILRHSPCFVEALSVLGDLYTRQGDYHKGLAVDERLAALRQDETVFYNLACSYSLVGDLPRARQAISRAVELGYHDFAYMAEDQDLSALLADAEFLRMFAQWQKRPGKKAARKSRESV